MKKLNLGSGTNYRPGFINADFDKSIKADIYIDLKKKLPFKNGDIDYILLQDVLEHLTKEDGKKLLIECHRILKVNSELEIRVPDVYQLFEDFGNDPGVLFRFLYGDTSKNGDLGSHKYGYSKETLEKLLKSIDLVPSYVKKEATNIIVSVRKKKFAENLENVAFSLLDSGGFGGAENFIYQLSRVLFKNIKNITFFICKDTLPDYLKTNKKLLILQFPFRLDFIGNIKGLVKSVVLSPAFLMLSFFHLLKFKKMGGQLVVLSGISDKIFLTPVSKLFGLSVVWVEYGPLDEVFRRNIYLPKIMYRLIKNLPDRVICPSENTKKSLVVDARVSESIINIIPCGIDLKK